MDEYKLAELLRERAGHLPKDQVESAMRQRAVDGSASGTGVPEEVNSIAHDHD